MSKEKFVPWATPGTVMNTKLPFEDAPPPPPHPLRITLATNAKPRARYLIISSSCFSPLALLGRTVKTICFFDGNPG
jgi:hypothetical protein